MNLAIIIPAYKISYFEDTLNSLAAQTCKDFNVYIGDDNSPHDLYHIVAKFEDRLNIIYKKFDENLGGKSLVKHWIRCIEMSKTEKWIWLFSDDDLISTNCVFDFFKNINSESELYKFRTVIIDKNNTKISYKEKNNKYSRELSTREFLKLRLRGAGFRSYVVEYIFSRRIYEYCSIIDLPLAWCSDDLMWTNYSLLNNQKISCLESIVYWRSSGENITSITDDAGICEKKIDACLLFVHELKLLKKVRKFKISNFLISNWFVLQLSSLTIIRSYNDFENILLRQSLYSSKVIIYFMYILMRFYKFKRKIVLMLKRSA